MYVTIDWLFYRPRRVLNRLGLQRALSFNWSVYTEKMLHNNMGSYGKGAIRKEYSRFCYSLQLNHGTWQECKYRRMIICILDRWLPVLWSNTFSAAFDVATLCVCGGIFFVWNVQNMCLTTVWRSLHTQPYTHICTQPMSPLEKWMESTG